MKPKKISKVGLWYTLFSKLRIKDPDKFKDIKAKNTLDTLVKKFNNNIEQYQSDLACSFEGFVTLTKVHDTEFSPVYIKFPDLRLNKTDTVLIHKVFNCDKFKNNHDILSIKDVEECVNLVDKIRIDINPCLNQLSKAGLPEHKSKCYVIMWHEDEIPQELIYKFMIVSEQIAELIGKRIQQDYIKYLKGINQYLEEDVVNSRIITSVYYSDTIKDRYKHVIKNLAEKHSIKKKILNEMWLPLIKTGTFFSGKEMELNDFDPFLHDSVIEGKIAVQGVFGITSWKDANDIETTYIVGVSDYPRSATLGVHLPVIMQQ